MDLSPYDKAYALFKYCGERGFAYDEVVYLGDDYGEDGNDESVYRDDFNFVKIDDYKILIEKLNLLLWKG